MQRQIDRELETFYRKRDELSAGSILQAEFSVQIDEHRIQLPYYYMKGQMQEGKDKNPVMWVEAALHGDEYDGIVAIQELLVELDPAKLHGDLMLVPVLNPSAYEAQANASPIDQVNLNRVFDREQPGDTFSYRYGAFVLGLIMGIVDCVVDLHGGGQYLDVDSFATVPKEANEEIEHLAEYLQVNYICRHLQKGMLIERLIREGIPAILLESGGGLAAAPETVQSHKENVLRILEYRDFLKKPEIRTEIAVSDNTRKYITHAEHLYFEKSGVLLYKVNVGDIVRQGDVLLRWASVTDGTRYELTCPVASGVILSIHTSVQIREGAYAVMIGQNDTFPIDIVGI